VEILGHLIFYLPPESRQGTKSQVKVSPGIALGYLPDLLGIPRGEVQAFILNGNSVQDMSIVLGPEDHVLLLPIISGG